MGDYSTAEREFQYLLKNRILSEDSVRWMLARCNFRRDMYLQALTELSNLNKTSTYAPFARFAHQWWNFDQNIDRKLRPQPSVLFLEYQQQATELYDYAWLLTVAETADQQLWATYDTLTPARFVASREVNQALQNIHRYAEYKRYRKLKSPVLAGVLGIIPGGGLAYLGRWGQASVNFLSVAGMAAQSWEGFYRDSHLLGYGFLAIASGVYGLTIYNGVIQTGIQNRKINELYADRIREEVSHVVRPYLEQ